MSDRDNDSRQSDDFTDEELLGMYRPFAFEQGDEDDNEAIDLAGPNIDAEPAQQGARLRPLLIITLMVVVLILAVAVFINAQSAHQQPGLIVQATASASPALGESQTGLASPTTSPAQSGTTVSSTASPDVTVTVASSLTITPSPTPDRAASLASQAFTYLNTTLRPACPFQVDSTLALAADRFSLALATQGNLATTAGGVDWYREIIQTDPQYESHVQNTGYLATDGTTSAQTAANNVFVQHATDGTKVMQDCRFTLIGIGTAVQPGNATANAYWVFYVAIPK